MKRLTRKVLEAIVKIGDARRHCFTWEDGMPGWATDSIPKHIYEALCTRGYIADSGRALQERRYCQLSKKGEELYICILEIESLTKES